MTSISAHRNASLVRSCKFPLSTQAWIGTAGFPSSDCRTRRISSTTLPVCSSGKVRPHRQAQHRIGQFFRDGKGTSYPFPIGVSTGQMRWHGIMDQCPNARFVQLLLQRITPWMSNDKKVPDRFRPCPGRMATSDPARRSSGQILRSHAPATRIPLVQLFQFHAQKRGL